MAHTNTLSLIFKSKINFHFSIYIHTHSHNDIGFHCSYQNYVDNGCDLILVLICRKIFVGGLSWQTSEGETDCVVWALPITSMFDH